MPFKTSLGAKIPNSDEVAGLIEQVAHWGEVFGRQVATHKQTVADAAQRFKDEAFRNVTSTSHPSVRAHAERTAEQRTSEFRRTLKESSEKDRYEVIKHLNEATSRLSLLETVYPSPVALLAVAGLGSQERSRYHEQIAGAGPVALQNMAELAIAKRDRFLAAALLAEVDKLPTAQRPFKGHELADAIVGEEHKALMRQVATAKLTLQRAINDNRELETGKGDPIAKIALGIKDRKLHPEESE